MSQVLSVSSLFKAFPKGLGLSRTEVLKGVTFKLREGAITGFLGGNGAGKTTTIKAVLGLIFPDSGEISFFGGEKLTQRVQSQLGYLPERPYFYDYLTGYEMLQLAGQLSRLGGKDLKQRIEMLLKRVDLWHAKDRRLKTYSKGMLQKIGLTQALIHRPSLVILDEPMSGLDPDGRYYVREMILEAARGGASVFFSSHLMNDTEQICQDLVMMKAGQVIYYGDSVSLLNSMGITFEVSAQGPNGIESFVEADNRAVQIRVRDLIAEGREILSVRQSRASLEETFIKLALRGGPQP